MVDPIGVEKWCNRTFLVVSSDNFMVIIAVTAFFVQSLNFPILPLFVLLYVVF